MTKAEWAKLPADYKGGGVRRNRNTSAPIASAGALTHGCTLVNVYITDMKTVEIPGK